MGKQIGGIDDINELDMAASAAEGYIQRKDRLRLIQIILAHTGICRRRGRQRQNLLQRRTMTKTACRVAVVERRIDGHDQGFGFTSSTRTISFS